MEDRKRGQQREPTRSLSLLHRAPPSCSATRCMKNMHTHVHNRSVGHGVKTRQRTEGRSGERRTMSKPLSLPLSSQPSPSPLSSFSPSLSAPPEPQRPQAQLLPLKAALSAAHRTVGVAGDPGRASEGDSCQHKGREKGRARGRDQRRRLAHCARGRGLRCAKGRGRKGENAGSAAKERRGDKATMSEGAN